jgi:16S rRNA G966 N2-methylase RsmD
LSKLVFNPKNNNKHPDDQIERLAKLIEHHGFRNPIVVSNRTGFVVAGHGRIMAARKLGITNIPVMYQDFDNEAQEYTYLTSDNAIASWAELDLSLVNTEMLDLGPDFDIDLLGIKDFELIAEEKYSDGEKGSMEKNFIAPPFSVLDTRQEYWLNRRKKWLALGIESESGRNAKAFSTGGGRLTSQSDTSIFDPVLAEIAYTWFSPKGGTIIDCFAGGSVRGIVASHTGRQYVGVDLRQEQVTANQEQEHIAIDPKPIWHCSDSRLIDTVCHDVRADMVFSCPPYADLEVYSDDKKDLSNLSYIEFKDAYFDIIKKTCSLLKDDSFACFVVGEVRGKDGGYYNFVGDTINAFKDAGLSYYNEMVLINSAGTLPLRAGKSFKASRKVGKMHQNVLVFVKGDAKAATARCGDVSVMETENDE